MPSQKLYEGFVELGIDFSKFNSDLARARSMLAGLGSGTAGGGFAAGISAGIASGMMQGITSGSARARTAMSQVAAQGVAQGIAAGMAQTRSTAGRGMASGGGGGFGGVGSAAAGFAQGLGLPFSLNPAMVAGQLVGKGVDLITDGLRASVSTAIELESTFTDIQRVSGKTAEDVGGFKKVIFDIATTQAGSSVEDLTQIAGIGARMGVTDQEGMAGLETFTRSMAKVRNAVQGIGTEQLANDMGKMLSLFHQGTGYLEGFGSALAKMDEISKSSAADILDMSKNLSGTFESLGMTIPQVMAFSSVLADVGLENAQGSSSFSQILRMLASQSEKMAGLIGVPVDEFQKAIRTNAMDALGMLIAKFRELNEVDPVKAQEFLVSLGFRGVRTAGALQQLSAMFEEVSRRTAMANEEVKTLNTLTTANELNSKTTAGAIGLFKNAVTELGDAVGKNLLGPLTDVTKQATAMVKALSGVTPEVVGGITGAASGLAGLVPGVETPSVQGATLAATGGTGGMVATVAEAVYTGFTQGWTKAADNPPPPATNKVFDAWMKEKQDQSPAAMRARMLEAETADNERRRAAAMAKSPRPLSLREIAEAEVGAKPEGKPGEALDEKLNVWNDTVNRHHQRLIDEQNQRTVAGMRERMGEENLARFDMAQTNRPGAPVVKALMGDVADAMRGGFKTMLTEARTDEERQAVVADQARTVRERLGMFGRVAAAGFAGGGVGGFVRDQIGGAAALAPAEKEKEEKAFRSQMFADPAEYARDAIGKALSTKEKDDEQKKTNDHLKDIKTDISKFLGKALARGGAILQGRA